MTLVCGTTLLYVEYCYFSTDGCPIDVAPPNNTQPSNIRSQVATTTLINSTSRQTSSCDKTRFINPELVNNNCQPISFLNFKINYLYRNQGRGDFLPFGESSVLHSGDSLKLLFQSTEEAYVYIFMVDSHGNIGRLFPSGDFRGASQVNHNPVQKNVQYFVPSRHKSFRLDQNIGEESIYFIATREPDEALEQQYQELFEAQQMQAVDTITIIQEQIIVKFREKQRLITPELVTDVIANEQPTTFEENGQSFSVLPIYLNNLCEVCIYRVTFRHR